MYTANTYSPYAVNLSFMCSDLMLILFEEDGCHFTMVAPDSNIYQQNCKYPNGTCSGSHIICPNDLGIPLFLLQALECAEIDLDGIVNCPSKYTQVGVLIIGLSGLNEQPPVGFR